MSVHRIVRIIARLNIGGPAIHATLLTAGLNHGRFATTLLAGAVGPHEGDMTYYATARNVYPVIVPALGPELGLANDLRALASLRAHLRTAAPAIVHTHTAKAGALGRAAALLRRVPVIMHTFHGHVFRGYFGPRQTAAFLRIERTLARRTTTIIAVSARLRDELVDEFHLAPRERIHVVPLGLDLTPFQPAERLRGRFRPTLGIEESTPLIGIVGRLVPIKRHDLFLRAARLLRDRIPSAQFALVGDGELRETLRSQSAALGLAGCTHFVGWQRDMAAVYADLDVVALTSGNEGTPVSLIEAQASGIPVVATEVGGVRDTVAAGETGLLVASDPVAVAEGLERALLDADLRRQAQSVGPQWTQARFSIERLVREMTDLYNAALAARGLP